MDDPIGAPGPLTLPDGRPARALWSLSTRTLHLNHGSFGAVPVAAQQHQQELRQEMEADPVAWFGALPARVARAREDAARFLGVDPARTALVPNASAGASVVFASLATEPGWQGAEVVVTDHGYGAVVLGAERAARRWGGRLRTARVPLGADGETAYDAVLGACTPATRLLVVDQITSATGKQLPVAAICAAARERGILTVVDGAHAPGLLARPLDGLDCDVWVGNLHKWACAPRGTAALVVGTAALRERLHPLVDSWGMHEPFPARFDYQGTLDVTGWLAAATAHGTVEDAWSWDVVRRHVSALADHAAATVAGGLGRVTGEDHRVDVAAPAPSMRLVRLPAGLVSTDAEALALRDRVLARAGVAAAFTAFDGRGYWRLSAHAYNTAEDYEVAAERVAPLLVGQP